MLLEFLFKAKGQIRMENLNYQDADRLKRSFGRPINIRFIVLIAAFFMTWTLLHEIWGEIRQMKEQMYEIQKTRK